MPWRQDHPPSSTNTPGWRRALPLLRLGAHGVFLALWVVWWTTPEEPGDLLSTLALSWLGLLTLGLALALAQPRLRPRLLGAARGLLRPLDLLSVNLLVLLVLGESSLRVLSAVSDSPLFAPPDAKAKERIQRWRLAPGRELHGFPANLGGYYDRDHPVAAPEGVHRILALGDSFAVGVVPYEQNFLTRLEQRLDQESPTEVLNLGVVSIGPREYLHLYRTEGRALQPDLVLLCLFVGNDIVADRRSSLLHSDSLALFTVPRRAWAMVAEERGRERAGEGIPGTAGFEELSTAFTEQSFLGIERERLKVCRIEPDRRARRAYEDTFAALDDIIREVGPALRVVLIPDEFQVRDSLYERITDGPGPNEPHLDGQNVTEQAAQYQRDLPQQRLAAFFSERGVPTLDLLPALREAELGGRTYAERDTHWNARGNEVASEALAEWLRADAGD